MKITKSKLKEMIKQELNEYEKGSPEEVAERVFDAVVELQHQIKRINFKKVREWGTKYYRSAPGLVNMLTHVTKWIRKIKWNSKTY